MSEAFGLQVQSEEGRKMGQYIRLINTIRQARDELSYFSHPACAPSAKPLLDEWGWACRELARMNGGKPVLTVV